MVAGAVVAVLATGGGRSAVVATVSTGVVAFVALAAFLDAILVPGNPDVRRQTGDVAGLTGAVATGGGHGGSGDGSCG